MQIQAKGSQPRSGLLAAGTAVVTASAEGKTSAALNVSVTAPCCQIGEGAPTAAIQQAFQDAVTRNKLSVQLPAGFQRGARGQWLRAATAEHWDAARSVPGRRARWLHHGLCHCGRDPRPIPGLGGPAGTLGYPQSDATPGGRQTFERGTLAGNPVQLVAGAILAKWGALGYETGVAGPPTAAATTFQTFRGITGTMQSFQNALILRRPAR